MANSKAFFNSVVGSGGLSLLPEYQAVVSYAAANGISIPPEQVLLEDNARLGLAIASGEWADWDIFYYMRDRAGYREYAKINWKAPGTFTLTEVGGLTFDNDGFTGNGSSGYLRTGWIANTHGVKYTLNNGGAIAHTQSILGSSGNSLFGCRAATNTLRLELIPNSTSTAAYCINSTSSASASGLVVWTQGMWHIQRTLSNQVRNNLDAFQLVQNANTSTGIPSQELYLLCRNNNGVAEGFLAANLGVFAVGANQSGREYSINVNWSPLFDLGRAVTLGFTPVNTYSLGMSGQSNSQGFDPIANLPTPLVKRYNNVMVWWNPNGQPNSGRWYKLEVGVNNNRESNKRDKFGAEIGIASQFEQEHPNDVLYLTKFGIGGSAVNITPIPTWAPGAAASQLYAQATADWYGPSTTSLALIAPGYIEKGMIWMQGEEDAGYDVNADTATFVTNTDTLFTALRTYISKPNWPIVVCRLNASIVRDAPKLASVRAAQGTAAGMLCDPGTYPHNTHFNTDSYLPLLDTVHFPQLQFGIDLYSILFP